ncbi:hypothetical protein VTK73DRAFT_4518 [Phialemonium thermophilum]|uniref:Uncharacterized protein n=1 Tax=Phialemonium thermophilum TaxID=223376 RepID=A0ABR3WTN1_9PEZI
MASALSSDETCETACRAEGAGRSVNRECSAMRVCRKNSSIMEGSRSTGRSSSSGRRCRKTLASERRSSSRRAASTSTTWAYVASSSSSSSSASLSSPRAAQVARWMALSSSGAHRPNRDSRRLLLEGRRAQPSGPTVRVVGLGCSPRWEWVSDTATPSLVAARDATSQGRSSRGMPHRSDCLISRNTTAAHSLRFGFFFFAAAAANDDDDDGPLVCSPMLIESRRMMPVSGQHVSDAWHDMASTCFDTTMRQSVLMLARVGWNRNGVRLRQTSAPLRRRDGQSGYASDPVPWAAKFCAWQPSERTMRYCASQSSPRSALPAQNVSSSSPQVSSSRRRYALSTVFM